MMQGLLTARQYFKGASTHEHDLYRRITALWEGVEWDWYRDNKGSDFIYWHWSPQWGFQIHHPLIGFNETMVVYLLAIASPTHSVPADMYYSGWASQDKRALEYRQGWSEAPRATTMATAPPILASSSTWAWAAVDRCSSRITPSWDSIRTACAIATHRRTLRTTAISP